MIYESKAIFVGIVSGYRNFSFGERRKEKNGERNQIKRNETLTARKMGEKKLRRDKIEQRRLKN
jgi:hypothetical protein